MLPPLTNTDAGPVAIEMLQESEHSERFSFSAEEGTISLIPGSTVEQCPNTNEINLEFSLSSDTLGQNKQTIAIPVSSEAAAESPKVNDDGEK